MTQACWSLSDKNLEITIYARWELEGPLWPQDYLGHVVHSRPYPGDTRGASATGLAGRKVILHFSLLGSCSCVITQ